MSDWSCVVYQRARGEFLAMLHIDLDTYRLLSDGFLGGGDGQIRVKILTLGRIGW